MKILLVGGGGGMAIHRQVGMDEITPPRCLDNAMTGPAFLTDHATQLFPA